MLHVAIYLSVLCTSYSSLIYAFLCLILCAKVRFSFLFDSLILFGYSFFYLQVLFDVVPGIKFQDAIELVGMQPLSSATAATKRSQPSFFLKACMMAACIYGLR